MSQTTETEEEAAKLLQALLVARREAFERGEFVPPPDPKAPPTLGAWGEAWITRRAQVEYRRQPRSASF